MIIDKVEKLDKLDKLDKELRTEKDKQLDKPESKPPIVPLKRNIKTLNPYQQPPQDDEKEKERKDMSNLMTPINVMKKKKDERKNSMRLVEAKRSRSGSVNGPVVKHI